MTQPDFMVLSEVHRAAFEQGPDALFVVDSKATIIALNSQAELLVGRSRKEVIGQKVEVLIPAGLREQHIEHRSLYMRNPYRRVMGPGLELQILQKQEDGEYPVMVDINLSPVPISIGVVVILTVRQRDGVGWPGGTVLDREYSGS